MSGWYRNFFQCTDSDCGFVFTNIGQEHIEVEACPACASATIDYAYNENRTKFAKELYKELKIMDVMGELE